MIFSALRRTRDEETGSDPGFLERGLVHIYIKVWGVSFADFI